MNTSGTISVEEYGALGRMDLSEDMARGFAVALGATPAFTYQDDTTEQVFSGGDKAPVEGVQILYFAGLGSEIGPAFSSGASATADMMDLGSGSLAYAAFDCCKMLRSAFLESWQNAFEGLHYLLGFGGFVWQDATRGARFAECLQRGAAIGEAWRRAAIETVPPATSWCVLRAVQKGLRARDEFWSNDIQIASDPGRPFAFLIYQENAKPAQASPPVVFVDRLPLFRTPTVIWTPGDQLKLARKLGLDQFDVISPDGWIELRSPGATLELYQGSGAFWLRRPRPQEVALFNTIPTFPPSDASAIAHADAYLTQRGLMNERSYLHSVSVTEETHRSSVTDHGRRSLSFGAALHVNSIFHIAVGSRRLPVFGAGAKTRVTLENGEVSEVLRFWREPVKAGEVGIMGVNEARELLVHSEAFEQVPRETLKISPEVRLGYYALPPREAQDYLLPVYEFRGTVIGRGGLTQEFTRFVQAVREGERPSGEAFRLRTVLP